MSISTMPDLTGHLCPESPSYLGIRNRLNQLIERYLNPEILSHCLTDLPVQFTQPHQRPWERVDWKGIHFSQIKGIAPELFVQLLASAAEIESPIRSYSRESWDYLRSLHEPMAHFLGGTYGEDQAIQVVGIWEKEERQHCPALKKMYQQLTGQKLSLKPNTVSGYHPAGSPWEDACHHLFSRVSTEWSAISVYLWMMAHSTGALQQAIAQLLQDEVNHLAKFWGFSRWAFSGSFVARIQKSAGHIVALAQHHKGEGRCLLSEGLRPVTDQRSHGNEILALSQLVQQAPYAVELGFAFLRVMVWLRHWDRELSRSFLQHLFGPAPDWRTGQVLTISV